MDATWANMQNKFGFLVGVYHYFSYSHKVKSMTVRERTTGHFNLKTFLTILYIQVSYLDTDQTTVNCQSDYQA